MSDADAKRLSAALRRMNAARDFPHNTVMGLVPMERRHLSMLRIVPVSEGASG